MAIVAVIIFILLHNRAVQRWKSSFFLWGYLFIFFIQLIFMEAYRRARSKLGAGNPMLRTNTWCGSCLHRAQSLEWEMDVYPAVMQEEVHGLVGAWFWEPWPGEVRDPWSVAQTLLADICRKYFRGWLVVWSERDLGEGKWSTHLRCKVSGGHKKMR